jgi:hypothetical protein
MATKIAVLAPDLVLDGMGFCYSYGGFLGLFNEFLVG